MNLRGLFFAVLALSCPASLLASAGTEGASFLNIPVGAGPAALGSAYTALATDAYAPTWNPAGLGFADATEVTGQHLTYLESMHYEQFGIALPFKKKDRGLGFSVQYLGSGDIAGTDDMGASTGDYSSHYAAYTLAYGQRITNQFSLGLAGKMVEAKISDVSGSAYAADFGGHYQFSPRLQAAMTVTNVGTPLKFSEQEDSLPMAFHLSGAYKPGKQWLLALEGLHAKTGETDVRLGLGWQPVEQFTLRAGYKTDTTDNLSDMAGLTVGAGLHFYGQEFAYAWVPYGDLGDTQYFSLVARFGGTEDKRNLSQYRTLRTVQASNKFSVQDPEHQHMIDLMVYEKN